MSETETDFLTVRPDFLSGAATVINLAGNSYLFNLAMTAEEADARALHNDFAMVGQDIQNAAASLEDCEDLD